LSKAKPSLRKARELAIHSVFGKGKVDDEKRRTNIMPIQDRSEVSRRSSPTKLKT
jgi:hypothetical protein